MRVHQRLMLVLIGVWLVLPTAAAYGQARLSYGQVVVGNLSTAQPEARYVFSGREGDALLITVDSLDAESLDPFVILLDATQRQVYALDDNNGGGVNARLRFVLPHSGDYLIKVLGAPNSNRTVGAFRLALSLINPTPTPSPLSELPRLAALRPGESIRAELSDLAPFRLYAVYAVAERSLRFRLSLENSLPVGMYLYSADFETRLATAELNDRLTFTPAADGWHWLVVARIPPTGGSPYSLLREPEPALGELPLAEGVRLVAGLAQDGAISPRFATLYQFEAQSGSLADLLLQTQTALPALILLADDQFTQVALGEGALRGVELQRSGRYYVIVARGGGVNDTATGSYTLTLSGALTPPATPTPAPPPPIMPIRYGETLRGILDNQRFLAYYAFTGKRGESVLIEMAASSGTLDAALYLYLYQDNQPVLIASNDNLSPENRDAAIRAALTADGDYLIVASRAGAAQGTTQGAYQISLSLIGQ